MSSDDDPIRARYRRAMAESGVPAGDHPDDRLWERVLCEEATPEERRSVQEHVFGCAPCADIYRSLLTVRREAAAFDPAVRVPSSPRRWIPYTLAASVLLAAALAVFAWRTCCADPGGSSREIAGGGANATSGTAARPSLAELPAFQLDKAPVMLSASLVLTPRGAADDRQRFLDALGEALAPYRADDFPEAATRLEQLSRADPDMVEPALYAGVALLLSNRPADAVTHLERARNLAPAEFQHEIDWRLGLAYVHAGVAGQASEPMKRVCAGSGPYRERGCEAVKILAARQ